MKMLIFSGAVAAGIVFLAGCQTVPPGVERGPHGTIAYDVPIEASEPGVRIHVNNEFVGTAPLKLRIWGDKDGTFHDFGSYEYIIQALPNQTNHYTQTRVFRTGRMFSPQDYIPKQVYFDMKQPPPTYVPGYPAPAYYHPPAYYYYGPPVYFGPRFYFHHRLRY